MQTNTNRAISIWNRLTRWPGGRWLFSKLVCFNAPYFGSISPFVEALEPGLCIATLHKRRAVTNHIGTVHAIAVCNLAELAAGTMCEASTPATHRWIPKGMKVEYLRKAATELRATAKFQNPPAFGPVAADCPVVVDVTDRAGDVVVRAIISMWISPRKPA